MVRNLYLLRHGHAEHGYQMKDFDRELTNTGIASVNGVGASLKASGVNMDLIFASTSVRTTRTAEIIISHLGEDTMVEYLDEIYEASIQNLFDVIATADTNHENVMLIGHNPSISFLNDYLTTKNIMGLSPAGISKIVFQDQEWNELIKGSGLATEL